MIFVIDVFVGAMLGVLCICLAIAWSDYNDDESISKGNKQ